MLQEERGSVHADFMTILMTILCRFLGRLGMNILVIYITNIFRGGYGGQNGRGATDGMSKGVIPPLHA